MHPRSTCAGKLDQEAYGLLDDCLTLAAEIAPAVRNKKHNRYDGARALTPLPE